MEGTSGRRTPARVPLPRAFSPVPTLDFPEHLRVPHAARDPAGRPQGPACCSDLAPSASRPGPLSRARCARLGTGDRQAVGCPDDPSADAGRPRPSEPSRARPARTCAGAATPGAAADSGAAAAPLGLALRRPRRAGSRLRGAQAEPGARGDLAGLHRPALYRAGDQGPMSQSPAPSSPRGGLRAERAPVPCKAWVPADTRHPLRREGPHQEASGT